MAADLVSAMLLGGVRVVHLGREERLVAVAQVTVRILGELRTEQPMPQGG